ncbi:MAG: PIN domain-containing protein [Candidatus Acidiferrales bacterium]
MRLFVDIWGWLVLEDIKAGSHSAAAELYAEATKPGGRVLTTDYVLDETFTLLFRRRPYDEASRFAKGLLESPFITVETITPEHFRKAFDLRLTYRDKPDISFTDLTSMVIMRDMKIADVLTGDRHFLQTGLGFRVLP